MQIDWEAVLSFLMLSAIAVAIWRGGGKNPVGTGALQRQLNTIGSKVGRIEDALEGKCSTADLAALRGEIRQIEAGTATSKELLALQGELHVVAEKVNGWGRATERTELMLQRIEGHFLRKGIERE